MYTWEDLPKDRLYTVLALRSEVFVVEQNCPYQDVDGKDLKALHLLGVQNGVLAAYARLFGPGDYFEQASIGRVVTSPTHRGLGQGKQLMKQAIASLEHRWGQDCDSHFCPSLLRRLLPRFWLCSFRRKLFRGRHSASEDAPQSQSTKLSAPRGREQPLLLLLSIFPRHLRTRPRSFLGQ